MIDPRTRLCRNDRAIYRELASGGAVLLNLDTAAYHAVNDMGALIWTLVDGGTLDDLVERVSKELLDAPPSLGTDVDEFLCALVQRDLVRLETS